MAARSPQWQPRPDVTTLRTRPPDVGQIAPMADHVSKMRISKTRNAPKIFRRFFCYTNLLGVPSKRGAKAAGCLYFFPVIPPLCIKRNNGGNYFTSRDNLQYTIDSTLQSRINPFEIIPIAWGVAALFTITQYFQITSNFLGALVRVIPK